MLGWPFLRDFGVLLHRFLALISTIFCMRLAMFLKRCESLDWIKKYFTFRGTPHNNNNNNNTSNNSTSATRPLEGTEYAATLPQLSNNNNNYNNNNSNSIEAHLAEVLVVNDTKIDAPLAPAALAAASGDGCEPNAAVDSRSRSRTNGANEGISTMSGRRQQQRCNDFAAPIAREEQADEEADENENEEKEKVAGEIEQKETVGDCKTSNHAAQCCWQIDEQMAAKTSGRQQTFEKPPSEELKVAVDDVTTAVRRSKSRVRTYLQKCKERLTGQHQHAATRQSSTDVERQEKAVTEATEASPRTTTTTTAECRASSAEHLARDCHALTLGAAAAVVVAEAIPEEDDDACSYEDIDFGLSAAVIDSDGQSANAVCSGAGVDGGGLLAEIESRQAEMHLEALAREAHLLRALQLESGIAALIDSHLARVYPVYVECTRAILIRQARDLLVCSYHGCLQSFEQNFLSKFSSIASDLKRKHAIGESLIWCQGWPLATPTGELILHLGALDDALLRPAEIYLCVKAAVDNSDAAPQLHAVWRSAHNEATVQNRCIDYSDPKAYLSALTLEMLSGGSSGSGNIGDDLPQLLQNLLVGVERSIERVSLNELQMPNVGEQHQQQQQQAQHHLQLPNEENCNNINNNNSNSNTANRSSITNSPKCALKRSELITKNKMLSHKYMLRRLTNRQDSMNSTSSGNSCASSGSASSDELLYCNRNNNNISSGTDAALPMTATAMTTTTQSASTSPALPLFCLGNSFPHIDSDEENSDEKRNSLEMDQFENEILPPSSITEIPEKLLTTGVYLPGTRDLQGYPIVTVEPDKIIASGLNCYEFATALLYYSTIVESNSNTNNDNSTPQSPASPAESTITAITTKTNNNCNNNNVPKPAQQTFTILIAIEKSQHLCVIDLICQSLKLLTRQIAYCEILAVCLDRSLLQLCKNNAAAATTTATTTAATANSACVKKQQQQQQQHQKQQQQQEQQQQQHLVRFISVDEVTTSVATSSQIPHGKLRGLHHHDARKWREFFTQLEPFQRQCAAAGQRLVAAMSDIRSADLQGLPTRRQLYAQHRALSRALMDSELHNLRKRGATTLMQLQELAKNINSSQSGGSNHHQNNNNSSGQPLSTATAATSSNYSFTTKTNSSRISSNNNNNHTNSHISHNSSTKSSASTTSTAAAAAIVTSPVVDNTKTTSAAVAATLAASRLNNNSSINSSSSNSSNIDVAIRLRKVTLLFNEVDRASKRLEQLTEQRRERLRELTRQRALEDEINEVTSWITSDGNEKLQRFANLQLDCETAMKEHEQEFEKYYFISMKHLAKGRDLYDAAANIDALRESASNLKSALDCFAEKLEQARERIEGATRLHQLLSLHFCEENAQQEMERLAEQIGIPGLLEKCRQKQQQQQQLPLENQIGSSTRIKPNSLSLNFSHNAVEKSSYGTTMTSSTPTQHHKANRSSHRSSSGIGSFDGCHCWHESRNLEDMDELLDAEEEEDDGEEQQSKIADSGLGGCDRCEGNLKLTRICSCQSLNEAGNLYDKSHNSDELDDECFERPSKRYLDIHSPMEANAHLQCFASNFELPKMEEHSCLDPKIQKTLLLIMREMIGTERDYVRSLYYVIENYVDELLRDDIPQPLRGQRNVIFGNIEKIFEFHNSHFLSELERYERNPLKVGAAFLQMESKFYLYALYNKNKPKSDTLLSEYGTAFFKSKQFELNDKMDLASYLLKPVQRMGKYALLLQQLVKACSTVEGDALQEIAADVEELQQAEEMVKFQLRHGNDLLAMDSLRDCDVNVKEQGRLVRQNEFLVWQGRGGKKSLRQIFLFEDLVLFSKARRFPDHKNLDLYIYKNSIKTSDIGLTAHVGDSPTKFEIWFRKRKPEDTWTMQCMSEDIKNAWTEEVSKLLWKQAKRNREIRLAEMSSMGIGSKPCLDIRPSNNQISDRSITITQLGKAPKLRHSFVGLNPEQGPNTTRRPNSLISESSISSGTSSSSLSTGSSSGHERMGGSLSKSASSNNHALELINETQTLMLSQQYHQRSKNKNKKNNNSGSNNSNTLNSTTSSSGSSGVSGHLRNHKRSTTLISQLSMESGILSDISVTPDQEQPDAEADASATTTPTEAPTTTTTMVVMRRHRKNLNALSSTEIKTDIGGNPYLKDKEETVNL